MAPYFARSGVTIYHGDCRDILPGLPKLDLVLTDPPYAIGAGRGEWSATTAVAIGLHESAKKVGKDGSLLVFTTTSGRGIEFTQGAIAGRLPFNRLLIWHKENGSSRAVSPWAWDSVAVLLFGKAPAHRDGQSSVYTTPAKYEKDSDHPAELPLGLSGWLYSPFDAPDRLTCDPFMGTGKLLDVPVLLGREVIGIEIEEKYCEVAARRLEHMGATGGEE